MSEYSLVYITFPTKKEAKRIGQVLVKEKLAACVNIFSIFSIYRWQGKIEKSKEVAIMAKTKAKLVEKVIKRVKKIHSYQVPCIISLPIEKGYQKYLEWIEKETK